MTFLTPQALWLLLLVPALVALYVLIQRRRKKFAVRYPDMALVREAMGSGQRLRRYLAPALMLLAIVAGIFAMARPTAVVTLPSEQRKIILAIDVSLSMRASDVEPTRLAAAQAAAKDFVKDQPADVRIGIVTFAGTALLVQPPTNDRQDLLDAIDRFELQRNTAIGSGIIMALATLFPDENIDVESYTLGTVTRERSRGKSLDKQQKQEPKAQPKVVPPGSYQNGAIILLTDGRRTMGPDPLDAAKLAADHGVRVYTVGFGSAGGAMADIDGMSIYMRFDEETLKAIADVTKAQYFYAGSATDLRKVYESLNAKFVMERKQTEVSALVAAAAAALLLAAAGISVLWSSRIT
ncbi:MAG TPA: VWA domain-containing protein [Casimicrobiaceae bacterium]|jgi:Ca-activated chloride channel family protein|nr:VWA domain-containing protein [Casimicrobiaceae bacterium]